MNAFFLIQKQFYIGVLFLGVISFSIFWGCSFGHDHDPEPELPPQIDLVFYHLVGDDTLEFNKRKYTNAAGNEFSVTTLEYYISDVLIKDDNGDDLYQFDDIIYVNAMDTAKTRYTLNPLVEGHGHTIHFVFGLKPERNVRESLPDDMENINMRWPEHMGGGYHFMKMEGRFLDSADTEIGYTTHIGNDTENEYHFTFSAENSIHQNIAHNTIVTIPIYMNILEWYQGPNDYDFNQNVEIMGKPNAQKLLKENGRSDNSSKGVFSIGEITLEVLEGETDNHDDHNHDDNK